MCLLLQSVTEKSTSDAVMYLTVYLLELCVSLPMSSPPIRLTNTQTPHDKMFQDWFNTNDIWQNVMQVK